jgi:signal transduction histidine kinase
MAKEGRVALSEFRVLGARRNPDFPFAHSTRLYPEWPFAKLRHTPDALSQRVAVALLTLPPDDPANRAANAAGWTIPLDYGPVHELFRVLSIGPYADVGQVTLRGVLRQYGGWLLGGTILMVLLVAATVYVARLNRVMAGTEQALRREVGERRRAESRLSRHRDTLERRVRQRTRQLELRSEELRRDIDARHAVEEALRRSNATLRRLHRIGASGGRDLEERLCDLLQACAGHFGMGCARITRVPGEPGGPWAALPAPAGSGLVVESALERSLCDAVLAEANVVALNDLDGTPWRGRGPRRPRVFLGAVVRAGAEIYGALCLFGEAESAQPYSAADRDLLQLMARWAGGEIARQRHAEAARQHQDELAHVSRLATMGELATGLAHELNQPLTAIVNYVRGCIRRLDSGIRDEAPMVAALDQAGAEAERAAEIIRGLREFVRGAPPQRSPVDINQAVGAVVRMVGAEARDAGAEVDLQLTESLPAVAGDVVQVEQVILNLMRNALHAMAAAGSPSRTVTVVTAARGAMVEIAVCDTGPGIEPGEQAEIFHPFYTTKAEGMGMGLSISRTIVEAHGGQLEAATSPEGGAEFRFALPTISSGRAYGT